MVANLVLNYENVEEKLYTWANEEKNIDFRKDLDRAERCTLSFAACELMDYLKKLGAEVSFGQKPVNGAFNIYLESRGGDFENEEFILSPLEDGIKICGQSRTGALYGAYEFLRMQGIRWLNPWQDVLPKEKPKTLKNIEKEKVFKASMPLGRGFVFEGPLKDSTVLWQWMARNRLNLSTARPFTQKFQKKLGMSFENGGHIFEAILDPDNKTETGKTFWEAHRDWYGTDKEKELTKEDAINIHFCMSNEELFDYLAEELIKMINTDWYESDRIQLAIFDTWGKTCMCDNCMKLGNDTDKQLNFVSGIRKRIDKALKEGRIDHNVRFSIAAYEGTASLEAPINPVPENIRNSGDYIIYYPIMRCYKHCFDEKCCYNELYAGHLKNWKDIPIMIGEYYNVSRYEDLPIVFSKTMKKDIPDYKKMGVTGMTYMHLPMINWGVRNLTESLYAQLQWDIETDVDEYIKQYYIDRYEFYADKMSKVYDLIEDASAYIASQRAWGEKPLLTHLMRWDGLTPKKKLYQDDHLAGNAVEIGKKAARDLKEAYDIVMDCWQKEIEKSADRVDSLSGAVNPVEMQKNFKMSVLGNLEEDIASLRYGINMMNILTLFVEYHDALYAGENTDAIWQKIDSLATDMMQQYMPIEYINSLSDIQVRVKDTLKRSQLNELYYRCKASRKFVAGK